MVNKFKHTTFFGLALALFIAFAACKDRSERIANMMSSGSGVWVIEKIHYTNYDTLGAVILDSVDTNVGEFVFFDSPTLGELFNYNACVYCEYDSTGEVGASYPCEFYTDKYRFDIRYGPGYISRTYTVEDWGSRKQTWVYTTNQNNSPTVSDLATQMRVFIKRK